MQDVIYKGLILESQAAFYAISATNICQQAKQTFDASATCSAALGRALMGTTLMAIMQKNEQYKLTTVFKGGGSAGTMVCVANNDGSVKGYISNPQLELPKRNDGKLDVGGAVGKNGTLRVIADLGANEPYIGETALVSGEIAEDFAQYFISSTQTPSLVSLGVHINKDFFVESASGIIIMPLPFCSEEALQKIESKTTEISQLTSKQKHSGNLKNALDEIFENFDINYTQTITPEFKCDCSKHRLEKVLISFGEQELREMIEQNNGAHITCHFCNTQYNFSGNELEKLIIKAK